MKLFALLFTLSQAVNVYALPFSNKILKPFELHKSARKTSSDPLLAPVRQATVEIYVTGYTPTCSADGSCTIQTHQFCTVRALAPVFDFRNRPDANVDRPAVTCEITDPAGFKRSFQFLPAIAFTKWQSDQKVFHIDSKFADTSSIPTLLPYASDRALTEDLDTKNLVLSLELNRYEESPPMDGSRTYYSATVVFNDVADVP